MYIGNGVTKKFPLPSGYDGSCVILKAPNGSGIAMAQGVSYLVQNGAVCFFIAPPPGVEICFDVSETSTVKNKNSGGYVVIYADGSMNEVSEDPILFLEEARKMLSDAQNILREVQQAKVTTEAYLREISASTKGDLDGKLESYQRLANKAVSEAALTVKKQIIDEWGAILERVQLDKQYITDEYSKLLTLKSDVRDEIKQSAKLVADMILSHCDKAVDVAEEIQSARPVIKAAMYDAQEQIKSAGNSVLSEMRYQLDKELEQLKSLRLKLERDYLEFNSQRQNYLDYLRRDNNG